MRRACCATRRNKATTPQVERNVLRSFCDQVLQQGFWECLEKRRPWSVKGAAAHLPDVITLDSLILACIHGTSCGQTATLKRGEPYSRGSLFLAYLDHAEISLSEAEQFFPPILDICEALADQFDYVTAKAVVRPPAERGPPITAENDSLLIQVWGDQKFRIFQQMHGMPVTAVRPPPVLMPDMCPGDVMFVPAGMECRTELASPMGAEAASAQKGPLLYLMLTLRSSDKTLGASFGKYLQDVLRDNFSEEADAFFRSAVTKHALPDRYQATKGSSRDSKREVLEEQVKKCSAELASKVSSTGLRQHYKQRMEELRQSQREAAEKWKSGKVPPLPPSSITTQSMVRVAQGITCKCKAGDSSALFTRGSETLKLPIAPTASYLIHELSDGQAHVVESLPCSDPIERLCVCQVLIIKDCLELAN